MTTKGLVGDSSGRRQARGGNTTISQKRDMQGAGHQSAKMAMAVRVVAAATVKAMVAAYAAVRSKAMAVMTTMMTTTTTTMLTKTMTTTTMTTTTTTMTMTTMMLTAAVSSVEAAAMVTDEGRAMAGAMAALDATVIAAMVVVAAMMATDHDG